MCKSGKLGILLPVTLHRNVAVVLDPDLFIVLLAAHPDLQWRREQ